MAAALRRATLAQSIRDYSIIYDTTDQGMNFQIFLVKEDGAWKINSM
jgi:hypothetical protein